jgi:bifunctional DNA-binding transcriptional regulator/antitoxin component of YhaV-PrlF toxin-antitoxin module
MTEVRLRVNENGRVVLPAAFSAAAALSTNRFISSVIASFLAVVSQTTPPPSRQECGEGGQSALHRPG